MRVSDIEIDPVEDILSALALLARFPVRPRRMRPDAAWAYPLAGVAVGAVSGAVGALGIFVGAPLALAALGVIAAQALSTGALHEDGLADTADGLGGGWDRARRLEIMKDSHIGTFGVLALVVVLLGRWSALVAIAEHAGLFWPTIAAAALSRSMMAPVQSLLPNARGEGLSHGVGRPARPAAALAVGVGAGVAILALAGHGIAATLAAAIAAAIMAAIAQRRIGGQTGDILGAVQQLAELAALCALAVTLS
ncbi:MAG: adenosylcobinamide-GDP ribazoletransferase [Alphaproteobacteria bacterium]|nr:MAG: adenosylcobinamide-GDP ribazoletransferase [Alphaproteobacteria bacterium]